ncbi:MAG: shikimate dehydrogenase [Galactobacter sp.]
MTYLMGLIGEGVRPSLTPPMHEAEGAAQGLGYVYRPVDLLELGLEPAAVGSLLRSGMKLGFDAFNVTHPCKQVVLEYLDAVDPAAARLGACNTVLVQEGQLVGYNTDRSGFLSAIQEALPGADLTHVVQLGAGGAGSAVADALVSLGVASSAPARLTIVEPDVARAGSLVDHLREHHPAADVVVGDPADVESLVGSATGLVNASPIGMFTHPGLPLPVSALHTGLWVADIVYRPARTQLIEAASALGCRVMEGGYMAVGQAADTFSMVTGLTADRTRMREHFRSLVAAEEENS